MSVKSESNLFKIERSKTNSGILGYFEKLIRSHPLIYLLSRYLRGPAILVT